MSITVVDRKQLWGKSGNRCAMPDCRIELFHASTNPGDPTTIGEECHIVAQEPGGPRGVSPLTPAERDTYQNLILMCRNHHAVIDDQTDKYTVAALHDLKSNHERWVRESLEEFDAARERDDGHYAKTIQDWATRAQLGRWQDMLFGLVNDTPEIASRDLLAVKDLRRWLLGRVWPGRYARIVQAFENFRLVLGDLINTFEAHIDRQSAGRSVVWTEKFYKLDRWAPEEYEARFSEYRFHVDKVKDLTVELTRAANLICDRVREEFDPGFRLSEGKVMVDSGPYMDKAMGMAIKTHVHEYGPERAAGVPYPGLDEFLTVRTTRDYYYGNETAPGVLVAGWKPPPEEQ